MKKLMMAYLAGVGSVLAYAVHCGPDAIVQAGLKLGAVQTHYAWDARPMLEVDEAVVMAELAKPVQPKRRK